MRVGDVPETTLDYTGQRKDGTGLLFYNARYYDPVLGRFISADSIVPGTAAGSGGAATTVGSGGKTNLTVDFHEPGFVSQLSAKNAETLQKGFWFQLSGEERRKAESPHGPSNPQALNRFAYVLNNPLRYTDPTGHLGMTVHNDGNITLHLSHADIQWLWDFVNNPNMSRGQILAAIAGSIAALAKQLGIKLSAGVVGWLAVTLFIAADALRLGDQYIGGGKGLDLYFDIYHYVTLVGKPTVSRQHGVYIEGDPPPPPRKNPSCPSGGVCSPSDTGVPAKRAMSLVAISRQSEYPVLRRSISWWSES